MTIFLYIDYALDIKRQMYFYRLCLCYHGDTILLCIKDYVIPRATRKNACMLLHGLYMIFMPTPGQLPDVIICLLCSSVTLLSPKLPPEQGRSYYAFYYKSSHSAIPGQSGVECHTGDSSLNTCNHTIDLSKFFVTLHTGKYSLRQRLKDVAQA